MSGPDYSTKEDARPFTGEGLCNAWHMSYKTAGGDPTFHAWEGESRIARDAWEAIAQLANFQINHSLPTINGSANRLEVRTIALELTKAELSRASGPLISPDELGTFYLATLARLMR
jgi:hypothetical protein